MADTFLAVDLGAESGRVIAGNLERFEVVHRFANTPVRIGDSLHWNILGLYEQIKAGIRIGLRHAPVSVGIDTWGVDYGLLDGSGALLGVPYHYRDARTDQAAEEVDRLISRRALYEETGIQTMPFNTLYQLYAQRRRQSELLGSARRFLTLPDLLHYWLSGVAVNESTNASTTQLRNPRTATWSAPVLDLLGVPRSLFTEPAMPGTEIGGLQPGVAAELGGANLRVVLPPCHDTAAAVVAAPMAAPEESVYVSSGTWSLLGIECAHPIIGDLSFAHNFTNEGGADGGIRFLKNIMGLWIVQECRRQWAAEGTTFDYAELSSRAEAAGPAQFAIEPNDERFFKPGLTDDGMADRIAVLVPGDRPGGAAHAGRRGARRPRKPGPHLCHRGAAPYRDYRRPLPAYPRDRRRQPESPVVPTHRRCQRLRSTRRTGRGHRPRQPPAAGSCGRQRELDRDRPRPDPRRRATRQLPPPLAPRTRRRRPLPARTAASASLRATPVD